MSGPGGAWANHLPVLAITSSNPSAIMHPDLDGFSATDNEGLYRHVTPWHTSVRRGERVPGALREALSGRPGPEHPDIPANILAGTSRYCRAERHAPLSASMGRTPAPAPQNIAQVVALMLGARRPLIVAGGGVARSGAHIGLIRLLGTIPSDHPACIGQGGFVGGTAVVEALPQAALVLALGLTRVAGQAIDALSQALDDGDLPAAPDWLPSLVATRSAHRAAIDLGDGGDRMHPGAVVQGVARSIGPQDLVTRDGGHASFWSNEFTPALAPNTRFHEPGLSHPGFGLPAALAMARSYGIVTIVHNNASWGVIRAAQAKGGFEIGTDLEGTDHAAIARALGSHGERLERLEDLDAVMQRGGRRHVGGDRRTGGLGAAPDVRHLWTERRASSTRLGRAPKCVAARRIMVMIGS